MMLCWSKYSVWCYFLECFSFSCHTKWWDSKNTYYLFQNVGIRMKRLADFLKLNSLEISVVYEGKCWNEDIFVRFITKRATNTHFAKFVGKMPFRIAFQIPNTIAIKINGVYWILIIVLCTWPAQIPIPIIVKFYTKELKKKRAPLHFFHFI